ncbi:MAG: ABC transporter ATP-binding protein, partial [Candidatus Limnocylindrales bacterium]
MATITLEGVTKRYPHAVGVEDLDLEIGNGQLFMLVGPSGCGKTTTIRLIAGLEQPDDGVIRFDGRNMAGVPPGERNVAMVFEGYALYPHFAVRDNLSFALRLRKTPTDEIERRVSEVAKAMDLGRLLRRRPEALAAGQAQSVAVGRAVVRDEPSAVLLDDALAHLDAVQRLEARAEFRRIQQEHGYTVISVTHDQAEALAVGTRVAVMDEGRLQQVGTPRALYEYPANTFVASFIGSPPMNLLRMAVRRSGGVTLLTAA